MKQQDFQRKDKKSHNHLLKALKSHFTQDEEREEDEEEDEGRKRGKEEGEEDEGEEKPYKKKLSKDHRKRLAILIIGKKMKNK